MTARRRWADGPAAMVLAASLLVIHASAVTRIQGPACIDDAYISFRYAAHLVDGHGLVFNPGERVEGYTNFGWTLLMAAVDRLGLDVPAAARTLNGALGFLLVLGALLFLSGRAARPAWAVPLAGIVLAADGSLARWSQDGMEVLLFAGLILAAVWRGVREIEEPGRPPWSALLFGAATLVRPEGVLLFAAGTVHRAATGGAGRARIGGSLALFAAVVLPHVAWRFLYYGTLIPNTFHAKVAASGSQVARGIGYVTTFLVERWPLWVLLAVALLVTRRAPRPAWHSYLFAVAGSQLVYVALVGGDWMGSGRFLVPVLVLLVLPVADAAGGILGRRPGRDAALIAVLALWGLYATGWRSEWASVREEREYSESRLAIAFWLRDNAGPADTILTNEIGQMAYFSGLITHDLHGLTDPRVARMSMDGMGEGKAGHEKADPEYSFSRKPTWVVIPDVAVEYAKYRDEAPYLADYEMFLMPPSPPRPEYQVVLRRREGRH